MAGASAPASYSVRPHHQPSVAMKSLIVNLSLSFMILSAGLGYAAAQPITRELKVSEGAIIRIQNLAGRIDITARPEITSATLTASSNEPLVEAELKVESGSDIKVETAPSSSNKRIDISLVVPERVKLKIITGEGEIRVSGDVESVEAKTETGTIAADVPVDDLEYDFFWTASRPRYLSDIELGKVREKSGGKFELKGKYRKEGETDRRRGTGDGRQEPEPDAVATASPLPAGDERSPDTEKPRSRSVELAFTTARGIVLLNIPPNEVSSDLRERPLTEAAKAIIRSGDVGLMDAIRRASPKYFGDYSRTLPPSRRPPSISERARQADKPGDTIKEALVRVTDINNRSIADLKLSDFTVVENGVPREILSVGPHTAPVNLVLLLDVSGSVDNYVNFIRKAARAFIETARPEDRISLVLFSEDVKVLSGFSTNKSKLSESLDTFDAGGATAYYDAVAYTLADTLRPLRGERTAIVVLTDGDDNRSFLSFESLVGAIEESGALIYPLYVPSALIATSESNDPAKGIDPLRARYMTLSARASGEGERLAKVSGGVYYPISQLSQIQAAYDDIVTQIRTAYTVTFRSGFAADPDNRPSPRLRIRVNKPNVFVQTTSVAVRGS
jgi:VWFA-related protein